MKLISITFVLVILLSFTGLAGCIAEEYAIPATATTPQTETTASPAAKAGESTDAALAWVTALHGVINWSPQLVDASQGGVGEDDLVLVVSSEVGSALGLDPQTGEERWRFTPRTRLWSDSVTVVGDAVFVASEGGHIALLDGATGAVRWERNIRSADGLAQPGLEARARVRLADGRLYVPTAGIGSYATVNNPDLHAPLLALDWTNGKEMWRTVTDNYILRAPVVNGDTGVIYVGGNYLSDKEIDEGGPNRIYAIAQEDGKPLWTYESEDGLVKSMWAGGNRVVFVAYRDFLVGLDAKSGEEAWRETTGNWVQSFAVFDDPDALPTAPELTYGSANAFFHTVDPITGRERWRYNIEGTFNYPIGNAVLADGVYYFITQQGDLYALDAATGALIWRLATGLETRDGIAVGAGHIFIGGVNGIVYAYHYPSP